MTTYISILRGINVSGHRLIKMDALKALFAGLGCTEVQTYIQSGNVVFRHPETDPNALDAAIQNAIRQQFGFDVPTITLTAPELEAIAQANPFLTDSRIDLAHLHVTFLAAPPSPALAEKLNDIRFPPDEFQLLGRAIYVHCPNGYGNTKLTNGLFETKLKVAATSRNWKTVMELVRKSSGVSK